ncbi:MAG: glycosyltransferase family 39 protein [Verrucomicrobiota bacterium]
MTGELTVPNKPQPRLEWVLWIGVMLLTAAVKCLYVRGLRVECDETQHLHVVWAWTQGLLPYRDVFDNHTPLFHMLCAPLLSFLGERGDIIAPMRWAMVPLYSGSLFCVYWMASRLYSRRTGLWAALLAGAWPSFLLITTEFRTDVLWTMLWLCVLAVAFTAPLSRIRLFFSGLLLGAAFMVSMKTSLLFVSLGAAIGVGLWIRAKSKEPAPFQHWLGIPLAGLLGACIVPLAIVAYFWAQGALAQMEYCVLRHNVVPGATSLSRYHEQHFVYFPLGLILISLLGNAIFKAAPDCSLGTRRAVLFMSTAFYLLTLNCWWPMVTRQDYLPVTPVLAILLTPLLMGGIRACLKHPIAGTLVPAGIVLVMLAQSAIGRHLGADHTKRTSLMISDALKLTRPTDYLMDSKGESVYRRRPFYYALEGVTLRRIRLGLIKDSVPEDLVKTRTCVASLRRLQPKSEAWVTKHFVPVTPVWRVAGTLFPKLEPRQSVLFETVIPAQYQIVSPAGPLQGIIDGVASSGPLFLEAGTHTLACARRGPVAVIWAHAVETGFTPFHKK